MAVKRCLSEKQRMALLTKDLLQLEKYIEDFWRFLPVPSCYVTPAFNILEVSKSLEAIGGFKASELAGEGLERLFADKEALRGLEEEFVAEREVFNRETEVLTKKGKRVPVSLSAVARQDEQGNIIGFFFAFSDITERKQFERELEERIEELEGFQNLVTGRELKMVELKEEIAKLKKIHPVKSDESEVRQFNKVKVEQDKSKIR